MLGKSPTQRWAALYTREDNTHRGITAKEGAEPTVCETSFLPENSALGRRQSQKFSLITDGEVMEKTFKPTQNTPAFNNPIRYTQ